MRNKFLRVATMIIGLVTTTNAIADGGSFVRGCAARDMQILMMLEQSESVVPPHQLNDAVTTMLHARMVCFEGRVTDALTLYDDIARSLTSDWVSSGQRHLR